MGEHLVLYVNCLARPGTAQLGLESSAADPSGFSPPAVTVDGPTATATTTTDPSSDAVGPANDEGRLDHHDSSDDEEEPLIQMAECRICQEEDCLKNFESPCACSGSLKYAHRKCVQHWCNEKGDIICEICHQTYQPGYTAPPPPPQSEETAIDIGDWTISGAPLELDPRLLAIAETDSHFLDTEYDDYSSSNASGVAFCRSAALILMALLLLRHALSVPDADADDDDTSAFFSLFLLRAAGFLLPCYIMAWAISILQQRRQRQEAAALAATQVAFVLQSGQHRALQFAIASSSSRHSGTMPNSQPETV